MATQSDLGVLEDRHRAVSLRYHARARRGYFGSRVWSTLSPSWDEADDGVLLARCRRQGYLEAGDAVLPRSEDSWEHFSRVHGEAMFDPNIEGYGASGSPLSGAPARAQNAWDEAEASRREGLRAESDRQWRAEAERRQQEEGARHRARVEAKRQRFAEALAREAAEFEAAAARACAAAARAWAAAPESERLVVAGSLELTASGELTPVSWQTEALYRVEGARRHGGPWVGEIDEHVGPEAAR